MDPYLEAPELWPDVHTSLMGIFREQLAPLVAPKYVAELDTQIVLEEVGADPQIVLPDVAVTRSDLPTSGASGVAVAEAVAPAPVRVRLPTTRPVRLTTLHLRERESKKLVAVIELLSPVNKRPGKGRNDYLKKRQAYLKSALHVIEIDLLRQWPRMPLEDPLPRCDYVALVRDAANRLEGDAWPISVRQVLPILPVPLLPPDKPVPLNLGQALRTAYERARYDLRIDYRRPPVPPLSPADAEWAASRMARSGAPDR